MLPRDPSSLFPVLYRKMTDFGVVSPLVHRGFLSTSKRPSRRRGCDHLKLCWLVEISRTKAAATDTPNLRAAAARGQCRKLVHRCGYRWKKRLYKLLSASERSLPVASIQTPECELRLFVNSVALFCRSRYASRFFVLAVSILYAASLFSQNHIASSQSPSRNSLEKELRQADLDFAKQTAARRLESGGISLPITLHHSRWSDRNRQDALRAFYEPVFANKDFSLIWSPTHAETSRETDPLAIHTESMKLEARS